MYSDKKQIVGYIIANQVEFSFKENTFYCKYVYTSTLNVHRLTQSAKSPSAPKFKT